MWHQVRQPTPVRQAAQRRTAGNGRGDLAHAGQGPRAVLSNSGRGRRCPGAVREPLPPPPEAEMPRLSPALRSGAGDSVATSRRLTRVAALPAGTSATLLAPALDTLCRRTADPLSDDGPGGHPSRPKTDPQAHRNQRRAEAPGDCSFAAPRSARPPASAAGNVCACSPFWVSVPRSAWACAW